MSDELWAKVDAIEGWLSKQEAQQLYDLCAGTWCEIGSWKGRSTNVLAARHHGYAIDWFYGNPETAGVDTYSEFKKNTKDLDITLVRKMYKGAVGDIKEPLQLLFLDGDHRYGATREAFELFEPLVIPGGYIVLHDVYGWCGEPPTYPGVTDFAMGLLENKSFENAGAAQRSLALKKL